MDKVEQTMPNIAIRQMCYDDCNRVAELIYMLKIHQKMKGNYRCPNGDDLRKELFYGKQHKPNNNGTFAIVAESINSSTNIDRIGQASSDRLIVGYMIYHHSYSIIEGRRLYITSFFIEESYRRCKIGQKIFSSLVEHAHAVGATRIDVPFMKDNNAGISFYKKHGAILADDEYQIYLRHLEKLKY